jgi:hypothetical protein
LDCLNKCIKEGDCLLGNAVCTGNLCDDYINPVKKKLLLKLLVSFVERCKKLPNDLRIPWLIITSCLSVFFIVVFINYIVEPDEEYIEPLLFLGSVSLTLLFLPAICWICLEIKDKATVKYNKIKEDYI